MDSNLEKQPKPDKSPRQSVTFDPVTYAALERLSKEKRVSIAWVVREAAVRYVAEEAPLPLFQQDR
ncbi:MAG TPA: CopG family transcriptional regulator [Piscinibacter sp.]|jgi:hypothetical protein|nr:CopG family transcriptional regulator [Piscinibacter sp.]